MKDLLYELVVAWDGYYWQRVPGQSLSLEPFTLYDWCWKQVPVPGNLVVRLRNGLTLWWNGRHVREIKPWSDKEV